MPDVTISRPTAPPDLGRSTITSEEIVRNLTQFEGQLKPRLEAGVVGFKLQVPSEGLSLNLSNGRTINIPSGDLLYSPSKGARPGMIFITPDPSQKDVNYELSAEGTVGQARTGLTRPFEGMSREEIQEAFLKCAEAMVRRGTEKRDDP